MALTHVIATSVIERIADSQVRSVIEPLAAAAEAEGLVVLHYDQDFDRIAEVTGQATKWVVPSGTID